MFVVAGIFSVTSCSTDECEENSSALPLAGFYSSSDDPKPVTLQSITVFGIGAPGDSAIMRNGSASEVFLPFDLNSPKSDFVIRYDGLAPASGGVAPADTLRFEYGKTPWFSNIACGVSYIFDVEKISSTQHFIDSVTCPTGKIDYHKGQNIRIYFHTEDSGEGEEL